MYLYEQIENCVHFIGIKLELFKVGIGHCQRCFLSSLLFVVFLDRLPRHNQGLNGDQYGELTSFGTT